MASSPDLRRAGAALGTALLTALLVWFGSGLEPLWPLLWVAPLPVLLYAGRASRRSAGLVAALGWCLGSFTFFHYFRRVLHAPLGVVVPLLVGPALVFMVDVLLFRALLRSGRHWSALLAFPATWVSFEYLVNLVSVHGTAASLAYTQLDFVAFLQVASLTGPWGMSFLLLLFPAGLAIGIHLRREAPRRAAHIAGTSVAAVLVALAFGAARLALPIPGAPVTVGLVASDPPTSPAVADEGEPTTELLAAYARRVEELAAAGARVVVLPEKLGVLVDPDTQAADGLLQSIADRAGVLIVAGLIHVTPPVKSNAARVYLPQAPIRSYTKRHLLPPFESSFEPGTSLTLLPAPPTTWGVEICKDMDFTPLSRRYGRAGVGLLLVPAWDFGVDRWWHGHLAIMRGVESGFAIARAAKEGYLTVTDNRGRVLAETRSDAAPFATLLARVPATHEPTLYLLWGDWFAWLAMAALALVLVRCLRVGAEHGLARD